MTENTYQPVAYQPPTLRIAATYAVPQAGDVAGFAPGHPDNVEVEINLDDLGSDGISADFVTDVIASLFRHATPDAVTVGPQTTPAPNGITWCGPTTGSHTVGAPPGTTYTYNTLNAGTEAA